MPRSAAAPAVLLGVVAACDLALRRAPQVVPLVGALDEPAHVATAALALLACRPWSWLRHRRGVVLAVLSSAVLIDLDHVPLYAGVPHVALGGRPFSHSLATVAVLVAASSAAPVRSRRWLRAAALGVGLHFVRDIATGPGLLLLWPLSPREVRLPYAWYAAVLVALAAVATWRALRGVRPGSFQARPVPDARAAPSRIATGSR